MISIGSIIGAVVSPVTNYLKTRDDNKTRVQERKLEQIKSAEDSKSAWELVQAEQGDGTWKDEYITIIITLPIVTTFLATFWSVYTGDDTAAVAAKAAIEAIITLVPNYDELVQYVCLAAIGIKATSKLLR